LQALDFKGKCFIAIQQQMQIEILAARYVAKEICKYFHEIKIQKALYSDRVDSSKNNVVYCTNFNFKQNIVLFSYKV
jgi:hypothetical protein